MKKALTGPVVRAATKWLKSEVLRSGTDTAAGGAVLVYRMVAKFPMTAEQYWQVADESMSLMPSAYLQPWLSSEIWEALSDWDGSGKGLLRLSYGATSYWANVSAPTSSREYMLRELRAQMSMITPSLTWTPTALKEWVSNSENPLAKWSARDIKALPKDSHADLLLAYLNRSGDHGHFSVDAVRLLIGTRRWSADQIQGSIDSYMRGASGNVLAVQATLVMDAWLDTLEWSPENTEANAVKIYAFLKNQKLPVWESYLPRIGKGLACLADNPSELHRIVTLIRNDSGVTIAASKLVAIMLASVNARLPDSLVQLAIIDGGLLLVLENKNYTVVQRLNWLKVNADYILREGAVLPHMALIEIPMREAIALLCFMEANKGVQLPSYWHSAGLVMASVAEKEFLAMHAPGIADRIDIVQTLGLSYADAVDMLIDAGDGKLSQPMLDLPEIEAAGAPGQAISR